jgi:transcriptional regulator with XRE-family HTH domain
MTTDARPSRNGGIFRFAMARPKAEGRRRARRPIDWNAQPLGRQSDCEIARRLGVSYTAVWLARQERGIPPFVRHPIEWDAQPLGEIPDPELAARLGVTVAFVQEQRSRRGIPSWRSAIQRVDWRAQPLGRVPDRVIATLLGLSARTVQEERLRRGIVAFGRIDWDDQPLGREPDEALARRLGVTRRSVALQRRNRGIAPFGWHGVRRDDIVDRESDVDFDDTGTPINWDRWRLGEIPDGELAEVLGVATSVVAQARLRRGIAAAPASPRSSRSRSAPRVRGRR